MSNDITTLLDDLRPYQDKIAASETDSITGRWEFGRMLLDIKGGKKQLPNGIRADLVDHFQVEASEITRRMQLAAKFSRDELVDLCTRCGGSWRRIIREELVKRHKPKAETTWQVRAKSQIDKLVAEARESDDSHAVLVKLLSDALYDLDAQADAKAES